MNKFSGLKFTVLVLAGCSTLAAAQKPSGVATDQSQAAAGAEDDNPGPAGDRSTEGESDSVRYAREYRQCLIETAVRMGRGNTESADVVVRAAGARCQQGEDGDRLFLMRTASETEAMRRSVAMFRSGVRGPSAAQIRMSEERSHREFLDYVNGQAIAAVLEARAQ